MKIDEIFSLGYTQEDFDKIKEHPYIGHYSVDILCDKIKNVYNYLFNIGFNNEEILFITRRCLGIFACDVRLLDVKFNYLESLYNSFYIATKVVRLYPKILSMEGKNIESKIDGLCRIGYTRCEVIDMSKVNPGIFAHSALNLEKKVDDLRKLGFSLEQVMNVTKKNPTLFAYQIDIIKMKIDEIVNLGYSHEDVIAIILKFPALLSYTIERIKGRIIELETLGYTREQILGMTKLLPSLFGLHIDTIREKKEFYDSIGLGEIIVSKPMYLMQSVEVSYARYKFFESIGIEINVDNYLWLFMIQNRFEKKYGKTKQELKDLFNYDKYLEENKKRSKCKK